MYFTVHYNNLQHVSVYYNVLQYISVYYNLLQFMKVYCGTFETRESFSVKIAVTTNFLLLFHAN